MKWSQSATDRVRQHASRLRFPRRLGEGSGWPGSYPAIGIDAMIEARYRLIGSTASPYAIKLRALLRYRRIPFDWVIMTRALRKQTGHLRPNLIPVLQYPDGSFRGETTTLAYDLENRHRDRSVIPEESAGAFVCDLLEDLADEWAVKPLFLYRWWDPEDQSLCLAMGGAGMVGTSMRRAR